MDSQKTLNCLMELVFDNKQELSEQNYINICNKLKKVHEADAKTNHIKASIGIRLNELHAMYESLLKQHDNIPKPNINNTIKYTAAYLVAKDHQLINKNIKVSLISASFDKHKPVHCYMYPESKIDNINVYEFHTCLHDTYEPKKRSTMPTKHVKLITDTVLNYTKNYKEIKDKVEKIRLFLQIKEQNEFFNQRMKIITDESQYLSNLYDSM